MGLFDFLSDVPIIGDVVNFGESLFGGDSGGFSLPDFNFDFDIGDTVKSVLEAVKPWTPEIVGGASAYSTLEAQKATNETNERIARDATSASAAQAGMNRDFQDSQARRQMDFQADQVSKQMAFQERMAGSEYQRGVSDLQKAGLNPMLALMKGGASSPAGAAAGGASGSGAQGNAFTTRVENAVSQAINSGSLAQRATQELRNMKIQNDNLEKQGRQIDATTELLKVQRPNVEQATLTSANSAENIATQTRRIREEIENLLVERARIVADTDLKRYDLKEWRPVDRQRMIELGRKTISERHLNEFELQRLAPLNERILDLQSRLLSYEVPGASNRASAAGTWWGQNVSPFIKDFSGAAGGAGAIGLRRR